MINYDGCTAKWLESPNLREVTLHCGKPHKSGEMWFFQIGSAGNQELFVPYRRKNLKQQQHFPSSVFININNFKNHAF